MGIPCGTASRRTTISLGCASPRSSSSLPGARGKRAASRPPEGRLHPCLTLLRMGVTWPRHYCRRRWSLTPPFQPYRFPGGMFLWPDPAGSPLARFPRSGCYPASCSVECGLSSIPLARNRGRPTNLRCIQYTLNERDRQLLTFFPCQTAQLSYDLYEFRGLSQARRLVTINQRSQEPTPA